MEARRPISIPTSFDYDVPIETQIPLIARAGFTHVSLGGRKVHTAYLSKPARTALKQLLIEHRLSMDTIHGPNADQPNCIDVLLGISEAAVELSVPVVVIHGGPFSFGEDELPSRFEELLITCKALEPIAREKGITFALENVLPGPATELVRRAVLELNPEHFGFCYDSAHDQIGGPRPFDLLSQLRNRVVAVHLSDRIRKHVDHLIPGSGFIDWISLSEELRRTPFPGPLLLEVSVTHSDVKDTKDFLSLAYQKGCWIYDMIFDSLQTN